MAGRLRRRMGPYLQQPAPTAPAARPAPEPEVPPAAPGRAAAAELEGESRPSGPEVMAQAWQEKAAQVRPPEKRIPRRTIPVKPTRKPRPSGPEVMAQAWGKKAGVRPKRVKPLSEAEVASLRVSPDLTSSLAANLQGRAARVGLRGVSKKDLGTWQIERAWKAAGAGSTLKDGTTLKAFQKLIRRAQNAETVVGFTTRVYRGEKTGGGSVYAAKTSESVGLIEKLLDDIGGVRLYPKKRGEKISKDPRTGRSWDWGPKQLMRSMLETKLGEGYVDVEFTGASGRKYLLYKLIKTPTAKTNQLASALKDILGGMRGRA